MLHYYKRLITAEGRVDKAHAIMRTARTAFEPFENYLKTAIEALEKKESIKARWRQLKQEKRAELIIDGGLYAFTPKTAIRLADKSRGLYRISLKAGDPEFSEKLRYMAGKTRGEIDIRQEDFKQRLIALPIEVEKFDKIVWGFADVDLTPAWIRPGDVISGGDGVEYKVLSAEGSDVTVEGELADSEMLTFNGIKLNYRKEPAQLPSSCIVIRKELKRTVIYSRERVKSADRITDRALPGLIDFESLHFVDGRPFVFQREENLSITLQETADFESVVCDKNGICLTVERPQWKSENAWWIQLEEVEDNEKKEDLSTLSPLRYFFDDGISVMDDKNNEYDVATGKEEENQIVLKDKKSRRFCFPKGSLLTVRVNTSQLDKQRRAIRALCQSPVGAQAQLLRLFEDRHCFKWESPSAEPINADEWIILTDESRDGCREQRQFVEQALSTPDFAFMEGPPGSGKTTVILELISQLVKRGKRVLLCGSTHVAIDNILERLMEKNLLETLHILPVRIGDDARINPDIAEFQIDRLINDNGITEDLLLDAANLICGTTIGILQNPQFKRRDWRVEPIVPTFDYLIIDESSKTTFQEFLVPALYAKRWILAGDVKQLSPFCERETIVSNIANIKAVPEDLQAAIFYLEKVEDLLVCGKGRRRGASRFILPVSKSVQLQIQREVENGRFAKWPDVRFAFVLSGARAASTLELTASDVIVAGEGSFNDLLPQLPETHAVLRFENWEASEHAFRHNAGFTQRFEHTERRDRLDGSFEIVRRINKYFEEKNWAEEIAWRVDREYQLREKDESKREYLNAAIRGLMPVVANQGAEEQVYRIAAIALPSILESLMHGIHVRGSNKVRGDIHSTVSEGFDDVDLRDRKSTLVFQHRMHPEISKFPRAQFYSRDGKAEALRDLMQPQSIESLRGWGYQRYRSRSVWLDVKGSTSRNHNYNDKEVEWLIAELKGFLAFAQETQPPSEEKEWTVACLTFYRGQEKRIREKLQKLTGHTQGVSNFKVGAVAIKLHTVDKFQGHEADVVFLSMVQTKRVGFMDNPNRLNVALTRARFQLVVIGDRQYFERQNQSEELRILAREHRSDGGRST